TVDRHNIVRLDPELIGYDLCKRGFLSLPMWRGACQEGDFAGAFDAHSAGFPTSSGQCGGRSHRTNLDIRRKADTHVFALLPKLGLPLAQTLVIGFLQRAVERRLVIRAVVDNAAGCLEWKFAWFWKIFPADLRRIHLQLLCGNIHDSLDQVS